MFLQWNFRNEKTTKIIVFAKDSLVLNPANVFLWSLFSALKASWSVKNKKYIIVRQNPIIIIPATQNYKPFTSIDYLAVLINGLIEDLNIKLHVPIKND